MTVPTSPSDLQITPRDLRIDREATTPRWWMGGDPVGTAVMNALSLTFPDGERFFIQSVKRFAMDTPANLAADIRAQQPEALFLFGGPSARRDAFDHWHFRGPSKVVDAVCEGDGEAVIQQLMALPRLDRTTLAQTPGLYTRKPDGSGWQVTGILGGFDMADIPSPYQMGLMQPEHVAYLETYRGCPLSCNFCAWGVTRPARDVFSAAYIEAELHAFKALKAPAVFLLDAGLNLNGKAFRNLSEAQSRTGILSEALFWAEIYPTMAKPEHLEFLSSVGTAYLGVGLQSMDERVLKAHSRPFDMRRFAPAVEVLSAMAGMMVVQELLGPVVTQRALMTAHETHVTKG